MGHQQAVDIPRYVEVPVILEGEPSNPVTASGDKRGLIRRFEPDITTSTVDRHCGRNSLHAQ